MTTIEIPLYIEEMPLLMGDYDTTLTGNEHALAFDRSTGELYDIHDSLDTLRRDIETKPELFIYPITEEAMAIVWGI